MKLIAVVITLAVVVLVIVGYELLMKLAKNEDKYVKKIQKDTWEEYFKDKGGLDEVVKAAEDHLEKKQKQLVEAIKTKLNDEEEVNNNSNKTE